jgi:molybdopterin converting factor small subunit
VALVGVDAMVRVALFGRLRDHLGRDLELATDGPCTVTDLLERLGLLYPEARSLIANPRLRACVESTIVTRDFSIDPSQTVELLTPVSGG